MLIKGCEPKTYFRLVYYNTKPLTTSTRTGTFKFGGLLVSVLTSYFIVLGFHLPFPWFMAVLASMMLLLLCFDTALGMYNTNIELKVLDTITPTGGNYGNSGPKGKEEGEQGEGPGAGIC